MPYFCTMVYGLRQATNADIPRVWEILQQAIERRRLDGSNQWQDGYPNEEVIMKDIASCAGYVLTEDELVIGYTALLINDEPEYEHLKGRWLSYGEFVVFHRVAIAGDQIGKGLAKKMMGFIEEFALQQHIYSVKADTNFDNKAMLAIFEKCGYTFCGEVYFRGSERKAYEKLLH